jgi:hypothetical protein
MVRKAVGDDFPIMTDANQAQTGTDTQPGVNRGTGGLGIELRKSAIRVPTSSL